ncbi:hypothetical protein ACQR13_27760 [Bradyrhizobium sp. HKCCYLRH3059]|uniref:hypothetical protein n=1 Tax=Bradyrhizobium sp. HKCCYLRH3059 TaxID=3420745 RepID=UPI003EC14B76
MISWGDVASWLLQTATATIAAFVAFVILLPTKLAEKYLSFHFDQKLEGLKGQQNQQIETLKEQLAHFSDRGKRSNEMEFAAIKLVWEKFVEAYLATTTCALALVEHPDFTLMSDADKEAFISQSDFSEREKYRLRRTADQNREYTAIVTWQQISRAGREQHEARLLLRKQRIFMPKELHDQFMEAISKLAAVYIQRKIGSQTPGADGFGGPIPEFLNSHEQMFEHLATLSNTRLFRDETPPRTKLYRGRWS